MINMVSTIDGKIVSGGRDETVSDLGSAVDHQAMEDLEAACDAVLVGAGTIRTAGLGWNPLAPVRVVVTSSGNIPAGSKYLTEGQGIVAVPEDAAGVQIEGVQVWALGRGTVDLPRLLQKLRDKGIERLLALGGSELNGQLIGLDLVDELFLTIAPKIKLGRDLPTYAGGDPLDRTKLKSFRLVEHHVAGDEVFLRYRR